MSLPFLQKILFGQAAPSTSSSIVPTTSSFIAPIKPVEARQEGPSARKNPFMTALNQQSPEFMESYGVNRPLKRPMFLGYRDNKALYGGSRLFILY